MRNIKKNANEGRAILERLRKQRRKICLSVGESRELCERIEGGEWPFNVIWEAWLFGLAVGYRTGRKDGRKKKGAA